MPVAMADLDEVIRAWAADKEGVPRTQVLNLEFNYDDGWGSDTTPGDPGEIRVSYSYVKHRVHTFQIHDVPDFINELAEAMMRGPITKVTPVEIPETSLKDALTALVDAISVMERVPNDLPAEARIAYMMAKRVLEGE